jgi:hypothetical protein
VNTQLPASPICPALQDGVYQPLEDLLPYHEFSLRFGKEDLATLVQQLAAISPERLASMFAQLKRYHKAFLWPRELGGEAFDYVVASLFSRLHRMWGVIY